ncbi:TrbG/VirB9 family P-type conjugative transfer protein [Ruegeria sp. EL01]|jgi:type IV secretion system protein VirB9|uniref:TrbG/VirB9 family P-type conjugative transfer protein n=1 Tax=Ruegeria sp. EL01 TaxID=2107578 RepID=UPI000EA81948|nr:TrbG/VirB9 family P-type conjugative transfer protein [Ruegeria sp. EL01]
MLRLICTAALMLAVGAVSVSAEQQGRGTRTDTRIRTLNYHPDDVYKIDAYTGYATTFQLEEGEVMVDEVRGDPKTWDFIPNTARDGFVIKAKYATPQASNLILETNLRTYVFLLHAHKGGAPGNVGFLYRFNYPDRKRGYKPRQAGTIQTAFNTSGRPANLQYSASGDRLLRPNVAFDDGRKTYLRLKQQSVRPSVFAMGADGRERLVNTSDLADGTIVVTGVYPRLVLRDGPYVVCVFNNRLYEIDQNRDPDKVKRGPTSRSHQSASLDGENR